MNYEFPDALRGSYGEPLGTCSETTPGSGVFVRKFANATVSMDCNTFVGSIVPGTQ